MYHCAKMMRKGPVSLAIALALGFGQASVSHAQTCLGLACEQVSCAPGQFTTITGTVYAPNGTDPLPNVTVYIPNAPVPAFTPGVSCPIVGAPQTGSPLVGAITNVDGTFQLFNVPVGSNIPLVIVSGRWRRQFTISGTVACGNTALPPTFAVMPKDQTEGDIPKIAIATGSADPVECVLRKMGIKDSEFTDMMGTGRINLFGGSAPGSGVVLDAATPTQASLMSNLLELEQYDALMLPCEGGNFRKPAQELANLVTFANVGGRVYSSHFSYSWMYQNPPFDGVANWAPDQTDPGDGTATVDTSFTAGLTLSTWLQEVGASVLSGQIPLSTLRKDTNGVVAPTQSWLTLNDPAAGNPVMQFVFDTPIASTNQCGRVLYNEYHVEGGGSSPGQSFPAECRVTASMTPQEKLLEYMLFELTSEGGLPSLAPTSTNFGPHAVGFPSAPQTFTWTNNSSFAAQVTSITATGDFSIGPNSCSSVAAGSSCKFPVIFTPTMLGVRTGSVTVASGNPITASLTGTGTPGYSLSANTLAFGNVDVGASPSQTLTLTSIASGPLPIPAFVTTGPYTISIAACGTTLAAGASCPITVTFLPTTTGPLSGTLGVNSTSPLYNGLAASLSGNGVDFTISLNPASGKVIAGDSIGTTATLTPIAGFAAPLTIVCQLSGASASACGLSSATVTPAAATNVTITFNTTSQFTVIGYGGLGGSGILGLLSVLTGGLLWRTRRKLANPLRSLLPVVLLAALGLAITGCSGKLPAQNPSYTGPGTYAVTVLATDGFLVHTATYTLTVTAK
jgi:hypothetical protein